MAKNRFLIAPFTSGLVKDLPIWQTNEESFSELKNAFVHRGVVKKRYGSTYIGIGEGTSLLRQLKSRLRILVGATDGGGDISFDGSIGTGPLPLPVGAVFKAGQMFSIGDEIFTVPAAGTPVTMLTTGVAGARTLTYNTTTGAYVIEGAAATTNCYWYPCEPVMGLTLFEEGTVSDHQAVAFDTRFAYIYTANGWARSGTQIYTGDNLDYFWSTNIPGTTADETALFSTNFEKDGATSDAMHYTLDTNVWATYAPATNATAGPVTTRSIVTAKIALPFKSRLLLFNTYELTVAGAVYSSHVNRVRFSAVENPLTEATSFIVAKQTGYIGGGYLDAPTKEEIVSVQYVKDRIIVYFERSTYELVYTFNAALPFVWQKLSSDYGAVSAFASVPSENGSFAVGATAVHFCNGNSVVRADKKIPDDIFKYLKASDALKRVHGIKEYQGELFFWSLPNQTASDAELFPDTLLVYNYENHTFATHDDCITCFGYFEQTLGDTWEEDYQTWQDDDSTWDDSEEVSGHRRVIAGNQHGFIFALSDNTNSNAPVLQVSQIAGEVLTVYTHNLVVGDYVRLYNSGVDAQDIIYRVYAIADENTIQLQGLAVPAYQGGATIARVSQIDIKSTAWNPYNKQGMNVNLHKIIFGVKRTNAGEITVNYFPSQADVDFVGGGIDSGANLGSNVLETSPYDLIRLEATQDLLWHSVYFQGEGNSVQIQLTWTDAQMRDIDIMSSALEIQGLILETSRAGDMG
jgi:hypothetical protein